MGGKTIVKLRVADFTRLTRQRPGNQNGIGKNRIQGARGQKEMQDPQQRKQERVFKTDSELGVSESSVRGMQENKKENERIIN